MSLFQPETERGNTFELFVNPAGWVHCLSLRDHGKSALFQNLRAMAYGILSELAAFLESCHANSGEEQSHDDVGVSKKQGP